MQSPKTLYSEVAKGASARSRRRHRSVRDRLRSQASIRRSAFPAACSFRAKPSGATCWCPASHASPEGDERARTRRTPGRSASSSRRFRSPTESKAQLVALYDGGRDPLAGKTSRGEARDPQVHELSRLSDRICGCSEEAANCFQGRTLGFFGLGCDAVPAADARDFGYPGFDGLGLPATSSRSASEPYIYHFPDGNASLARLLVRSLHAGRRARQHHGRRRAGAVRLRRARPRRRRISASASTRPASTSATPATRSLVGYVRAGVTHRVAAEHAVLACFHMMIPHIMPELPRRSARRSRRTSRRRSSTPTCWCATGEPWMRLERSRHLGADVVSLPREARFPGQPRRLSASARSFRADVPAPRPRSGRAQPGARCARRSFASAETKLLEMTFADFETRIRDELDRMLGPGGFSSARDIAAITVNRWPHGYGYVANSLFDGDDYDNVLVQARQRVGPGRHREFRRRRRRLRASRDRAGCARGARAHGAVSWFAAPRR